MVSYPQSSLRLISINMVKERRGIGRRRFLLASGIAAGTVPFTLSKLKSLYNGAQALNATARDFSVIGNTSLGDRAAAKGLIYGAFSEGGCNKLSQDPKLGLSVINECKLLVGGFYWDLIRPSIDTFNFAKTDACADFAASNAMLFRGHPLVWNQVLPQWLTNKFEDQSTSSTEIESILVNHITTVVKRYAGRIYSWDVVNEAIQSQDGTLGNIGETPWAKFLGADYIKLAFQVAAEADPNALLVYNDNGLEYDLPEHDARRSAVLKLLERLKNQGAPIHAFGMQSHLYGGTTRFNPKKLQQFLANVASLGLKILITELDVADRYLPGDISVRDHTVAAAYEDYLNVVLDEPAVIAVLTWGLSDRYTWLSEHEPRSDKLPVRTLPLDENMNRKLAWNAIARAFDNAPKRRRVVSTVTQ